MATMAQMTTAFKENAWEIEKVSKDFFERTTYVLPTYELCLDGRNVFYLEISETDSQGNIADGNIFKYGKDGDICESWSISGFHELDDLINFTYAFNLQP